MLAFRRIASAFVGPNARRQSDFVRRVRLQEKLRTDDDACRQSLADASFLVAHKGKPLLRSEG
jgi:hypothetical protein